MAGPASLHGSFSLAAEQQRVAFHPSPQLVSSAPGAPSVCCTSRSSPSPTSCSARPSLGRPAAHQSAPRGEQWVLGQRGRRAAHRSTPGVASGGTEVVVEEGEEATHTGNEAEEESSDEAGAEEPPAQPQQPSLFQVDSVAEADLKSNSFRSTRRTKLICTVGPACSSPAQLEALAMGGMNVARLNMCHGTQAWHRDVIAAVRRLNREKGYSVAVMMDTEGSEIHMGDFGTGVASRKAEDGAEWVFTVRKYPPGEELPERTIQANYDGFVEDVQEGDEVSVDGGMVRFQVLSRIGPDVVCRVIDPGLLLPRANITFFRNGVLVRGRNAMLPTISSKDWLDIDFGIAEEVDFIAISFVRSPDVLTQLRSYIKARSPSRYIGLIAKIESSDSISRLHEIVAVSDGAMVARGDLGAQIPLERVPAVQAAVVQKCRELNKPVIVASQLLESMIEFPTPTRAEVADVSEAVRQRADALMLSGESAMGQYPEKALAVLRQAALRMEAWCRQDSSVGSSVHAAGAKPLGAPGTGAAVGRALMPPLGQAQLPNLSEQLNDVISEELCRAAAQMARKLRVDAIFVYTRRGYMASLLSRSRPDCPIFAFTSSQDVRQRLNLYWGLLPFLLDFEDDDMEGNLQRTFSLLKARGMLKTGDLIISVTAPAGGVPTAPGHLYAYESSAKAGAVDQHSASGDLAAGSGKPSIQIRKVP